MSDYDYMKYIEAVGKKEARQFKRAMANPLTKFETMMMPQLIDKVGYYPLSDRDGRLLNNELGLIHKNRIRRIRDTAPRRRRLQTQS